MTEEIKSELDQIKKKPGPKPKGLSTEIETKKSPKPRPKARRQPMHSDISQTPKEVNKNDGYHYRNCADYGKGKLDRYLAAGYEFVKDENGDRVIRHGGDPLYLMRIPQELYDEDQLAKANNVIDTNRKINMDNAPKKQGVVPEYIPDGQSQVIEKDYLS